MMRLETIYNVEKYRTDLHNKINVLEISKNYMGLMVAYFTEKNITTYKKFDKRDLDKIKTYLEANGFKIYYNNCQDNVGLYREDTNLYLYIANKQIYSTDLQLYSYNYISETKTFLDVQEQAKNKLESITKQLEDCQKLQANFDEYIQRFNDKVKELDNLVNDTKLEEVLDIYIYAR